LKGFIIVFFWEREPFFRSKGFPSPKPTASPPLGEKKEGVKRTSQGYAPTPLIFLTLVNKIGIFYFLGGTKF